MKGTRAAKRYAKAFIDLSIEQNALDKAYADIEMILDFCDDNHDFEVFLQSPVIKTFKKLEILDTIFNGKVEKSTFDFINTITSKGREIYLVDIAKEFIKQYNVKKNILTAVVTSATGINETTRAEIAKLLKTGDVEKVVLEEKVNPELIGGLIVRIDDKQVDVSIKRQLHDLRHNFSNTSVSL